ncbi:MAG: 4Fe-4S binding protein [Planctomycetota bacterium]
MTPAATSFKRRLWQGLALLAFAVVPAGLCQLLAEQPRDRHVHVESFRYGKEPSVIRCNRGDRLHLTFSTRGDTAHSFFLQEFNLHAVSEPGSRSVQVFPTDDPGTSEQRRVVVFTAEHPGWGKYLVSKSQYRCHVWCGGGMHAFEHGNLIIEPNTLFWAGLGLLVGIPVIGLVSLRGRREPALRLQVSPTDGRDLLQRFGWLKRLLKRRGFQFAWIAPAAVLLYLVVLTAFFGKQQVAGRNPGVMITWVVWLFLLTAVLTPLGGRIWCLACPLPLLGECLQRRAVTDVRTGATGETKNRFFGWNRSWPRWLASDWPRTLVFLLLGTFSIVLVAVPRLTGWLILGLFALAAIMAMIWEHRAFCRYLCPVNTFVGLYSKAAKLALRAADPDVCTRCRVRSCLKGSAKGWACPYGLCVADINENNDCGLCTECIKTCPYDNVTLRWRPFAHETAIRTAGEAWMAMTMLVLAVGYCIVHLGHWPALRDYVNILDKANWHLFAVYAAVVWATALVGLPGLMLLSAAAGKRLGRVRRKTWDLMTASSGALIPMGLTVWIAFVVPLVMVNASFVLQSISDPPGLGWDLLGTANTPWHQVWPQAIPWIQVACVLIGLHYALRNTWRIWSGLADDPRSALRGMLPVAALLLTLSGWLVSFFAD